MLPQSRSERGRFAPKSSQTREVRSLRFTDATWMRLGELANSCGITRADLIEQLVESGALEQEPATNGLSLQQVDGAIAQVLNDPAVTRNGKDRGSVRRALEALRNYLSQPCNTR